MASGLFDPTKLEQFKKNQLIELVLELQKEKEDLKKQQTCMENVMTRLVEIERSHYLYEQYGRRESIEITGIPVSIELTELENAVVNIYNEAKVEIHGWQLKREDISACHRIGKNGVTIVRFVNRKAAYAGLYNGKNLKNSKLYDSRIFINNSFCREFKKYGYFIRNLKKNNLIDGFKIKQGVHQIKRQGHADFVDISHISDFEKYGLDVKQYM